MEPQAVIQELHRVEPARPRRRVLPDRPQGELHPDAGQDREADLHHGQRRRVGAGDVQGPRDHAASVPHRLIEGCLIAAHAIQSKHVFIYIRGEYLDGVRGRCRRALDEVRAAGLLGERRDRRSTAAPARTSAARRPALLESLEGKRGQPRSKPPFPAISGLYASPTLINNVETIATMPSILERRPGGVREDRRAARLDRHARSSASPATSRGPASTRLRTASRCAQLIYDIGGGIPDGRELKAVMIGRLVVPGHDAGRPRHAARRRLARQERATSSAPASIIVIDDR